MRFDRLGPISHVVKDAGRSEVDPARVASRFDAEYYGKLMETAWGEVGFVFEWIRSHED